MRIRGLAESQCAGDAARPSAQQPGPQLAAYMGRKPASVCQELPQRLEYRHSRLNEEALAQRDEFEKAISEAGLDMATSGTAALASIALGANPALATFVGASGPVIKFVQKVSAHVISRRWDRAARAVETAAEILDVGLDILEERTASDDARMELLARVLEAAARAPLEEKIVALGRVLADGLREDGSISEALILAAALADLEAPHISVLKHIVDNPVPPRVTWTMEAEPRGWERSHLTKVIPEAAGVIDGLIATLARHGLLRTLGDETWEGVGASSMYGATPLGQRCLLLLGYESPTSMDD